MSFVNDNRFRLAAFNWLHNQVSVYGDVLPRKLLVEGFDCDGRRISFLGPQGIWKPKVFDLPLSITTAISGPYPDSFSDDGFLLYNYQGTNPNQWDNAGLREAWRQQIPLIYFYNISKGQYLSIWPVYIVNDDPQNLVFTIAADDEQAIRMNDSRSVDTNSLVRDSALEQIRRSYITTTVKRRLHQSTFRERVLAAYQNQCALCRLKHRILLDAAHIIPDSEPEGIPIVSNGLSLCKLHHAAFDGNFIGITPDYVVKVREDILREEDGPMLLHGLQGMHEKKIILPHQTNNWPDKELLAGRYENFKKAI